MAAPADQALRAIYEAERAPLCWQGARLACLLAVAIVAAFGLLDPLVFPDRLALLFKVRLGWVTALLLFLCFLRTAFAHRHAVGVSVVVAVFLGVMVNVITGLTGGGTSPLYAGVLLVLFGMPLLFPWPPALTLFVSLVSMATYALVTLAATPVSHMLLNNLLFVASAGLIAVVSTAHRERLRWSEFVAVRHRSQFLARMSHELRTPIHVMIGYADILLEEPVETGREASRPLIERIRSHGVLLHRLISDLLDYAKVAAGKMDVPLVEPVAVREVVEQVAADFQPVAQHKGVRLTTTCHGELPEVLSNRQRLEQILFNLVGNAVKFTERGTVAIDIHHVVSGHTEVGPGTCHGSRWTSRSLTRPGASMAERASGSVSRRSWPSSSAGGWRSAVGTARAQPSPSFCPQWRPKRVPWRVRFRRLREPMRRCPIRRPTFRCPLRPDGQPPARWTTPSSTSGSRSARATC